MKKLAYITALILSLLIIYSGGGVSIVHYCCVRCETVQSCCDTGCPKCKKTHTCDSKKGCKDKGCTAIIYKLDLMKHTTELTTSALVFTGNRYTVTHIMLHARSYIVFSDTVRVFSLKTFHGRYTHFCVYITIFTIVLPHTCPARVAA